MGPSGDESYGARLIKNVAPLINVTAVERINPLSVVRV